MEKLYQAIRQLELGPGWHKTEYNPKISEKKSKANTQYMCNITACSCE